MLFFVHNLKFLIVCYGNCVSEIVMAFYCFTVSSVSCNFCSLSAKAQKIEMDKLEKAKKERTKVAIQNQKRTEVQGFFFCFPAEFHFVPLLFFVNYILY